MVRKTFTIYPQVRNLSRDVSRKWFHTGVLDFPARTLQWLLEAGYTLAYYFNQRFDHTEFPHFIAGGRKYYLIVGKKTGKINRLIFSTPRLPLDCEYVILIVHHGKSFTLWGIYSRQELRLKRLPNDRYEIITEDLPMVETELHRIGFVEASSVALLHSVAAAKHVERKDVIGIETYINADDEDVYRLWYWWIPAIPEYKRPVLPS